MKNELPFVKWYSVRTGSRKVVGSSPAKQHSGYFRESPSRQHRKIKSLHFLHSGSLHDRRFMSLVGRTRYFARSATRARSARRGGDFSPLFPLRGGNFSPPRLALRARVALRTKYRVRLAWLIKRLSCRLS